VTTLYCAVCRGRFEPDQDHVKVEADHRRIDDRNTTETFAFHPQCWRHVSGSWGEPA
jgi:hypothetical protein